MSKKWNNWEWNSQNKGQRKPKPSQDRKSEDPDGKKFPSYDAASLPSSSTSGSQNSLQGKEVLDLLKRIVNKDEEAISEVQKLLPNSEEATEADQLKKQQRLLNQIRKIQTKIGKKEASVQQKEQQMQQFLQDVRQHVEAEKLRHKKEVEQTNAEIADLKQQLQEVKMGKTEDQPDEMLEDVLAMEDEEKNQLRKQLVDAKKDQENMKRQVAYMQEQMDTFMMNYNASMVEQQKLAPHIPQSPKTPHQPVKTPQAAATMATKTDLTKDPKAPFGVRPQCKAARDAASPYGSFKGPETEMD